ncbi:MAG: SpoIIE family protein phosphatase [Bacteroidales bacterium]|nr:SpoIIE family protein phosphatase [Bacteroidales bacterium]
MRNYILFFLLLALPVSNSFSQNFRFKSFGAEQGLSNKYINNMCQGPNGYLWLGSGEGVFRFDGFKFTNQFAGDSIPKRIVVSSFCDSQKRIWFGYRDGAIAVLDNGKFKLISSDEDHQSSINCIIESSDGQIIAATQDKGLILIDSDYKASYVTAGLEGQLISTVCLTPSGDLLTGTFDGLFLYRISPDKSSASLLGRFEDIPYTRVQSLSPARNPGKFWVGTETDGLFLLYTDSLDLKAYKVSKIGEKMGLKYSSVMDVFEDAESNVWICTNGEGVFRLLPGESDTVFSNVQHFGTENGLPSNYISDVYEDFEGNLWFATIGESISVLKDQSFTFYSYESDKFNDNILSITSDGARYYLGGEGAIIVTDKNGGKAEYIVDRNSGLPLDKITSLLKDDQNNIWIGTSRSGIYRMKAGGRTVQQFFFSANSLENIINAIKSDGKSLWIASNGGVLNIAYNGSVIKRFTTTERLPHNKIRDIFIDSRANVWIATRANGLYCITTRQEYKIDAPTEMEFVALTQDKDGDLWGATNGDGVFHFSSDSLDYFSTLTGLLSDYCYSLSCDRNGNIWVGHSAGLSRINKETRKITKYSIEQGITASFNYNSVITSSRNNLLFGTSKGMIEFDPGKERKNISPPRLNITSLKISDVDYDFTRDIHLPYGKYKVRIDFIGIFMKNPESVIYQYKLDGYDDWSEPTDNPYVIYSRLEDGNYTFMLRACSGDGICTEQPLELHISVKIPVWKAWWFFILVLATIIGVVYLIIKYREKKQREFQEYLQQELDARTKEVVEQAEEIENKNRDITDSINYAQRIQASILPPIKRLQDTFSGSFVFYQPRDIVSGDFYWYDRVWDDKFVIVCADSTGHGVPGAFMSMIGTTLIKDICNRPGVRSPSEILRTLDTEIMAALNQNIEAEKSNDGMDIIVAEIDLKTKYLRIASAMRPSILYINGEQIYVKGSRNSVGGHYDQEAESKEFQEEGFQLSKGDIIYMFSDGYPDQFGGPLGKKFKMVRLKNLLHDIHEKSIDEQYNYIKSNFNLWKEDLEQVDDVLFMGLKI